MSIEISVGKNEGMLTTTGRWLMKFGDVRSDEYAFAWKALKECPSILDVACGTGTFLRYAPDRILGIDINPENVDHCKAIGLRASIGNALKLDFPDNTFDGVHSSHVMQVFTPHEAVQYFRELVRVVRPGGILVLVTLSDFRRFFRHPENVRPYPPDALFRLMHKRRGAQSPMFPEIPRVAFKKIWRRRPPLIELEFPSIYSIQPFVGVINALQYGLGFRKWWTFNAYSMVLRKQV